MSRELLDYAGGDRAFAGWLVAVNREILRICGLGMLDLADWNARDAFDAEMSPREAAIEALANDDIGAMILRELDMHQSIN